MKLIGQYTATTGPWAGRIISWQALGTVHTAEARLTGPIAANEPLAGAWTGRGAGQTPQDAWRAACHEAAERCVAFDRGTIPTKSMRIREENTSIMDPLGYGPQRDEPLQRVIGWRATGEPCWVDARAVFLPFTRSSSSPDSVSSEGLGAGATLRNATRSAVAEVIERDCIVRALLSGARTTVSKRSTRDVAYLAVRVPAPEGWSVVAAALVQRGNGVSFGSGAAISLEAATERALREAILVHSLRLTGRHEILPSLSSAAVTAWRRWFLDSSSLPADASRSGASVADDLVIVRLTDPWALEHNLEVVRVVGRDRWTYHLYRQTTEHRHFPIPV